MMTGATGFFLVYFIIMGIAALVLYTIIRLAVRNGVREANDRLLESVRVIEKTVYEIKTKKESS